MDFRRIKSLIVLLEDENQKVASSALSELLKYGKEAGFLIKRFQESPNVLLRKRIHQLQAIARVKALREMLSRRLNNVHSGLWNGLLEIHMLWFDRDIKDNINELFWALLDEFKANCDFSAQAIASFMKSRGFVIPIKGDIDAEFYCIGPVLESKIGTEAVLSALVWKLLLESGKKAKIVKIREGFGVFCYDGYVIIPNDWEAVVSTEGEYREYSPGEVLKSIAFKLFLSTITSDSFRYSYTIGSCVGKTSNSDTSVKLSSILKENTK
jgi:hypothetical protein